MSTPDPGTRLSNDLKMLPLNPFHQENLRKQMEKWIENDITEHSQGPWAFPLVAAPKKGGSIHWAVDYKGLNKMTVKDLPRAQPPGPFCEVGKDGPRCHLNANAMGRAAHAPLPTEEEQRLLALEERMMNALVALLAWGWRPGQPTANHPPTPARSRPSPPTTRKPTRTRMKPSETSKSG